MRHKELSVPLGSNLGYLIDVAGGIHEGTFHRRHRADQLGVFRAGRCSAAWT